jgi:predicted ferric reductase
VNPQVWWYLSRATGVVGWALASLSVLWGLALSGRPFGRNPTGPWLLDLHRYLGGLSVLFVGAHVGSIVGDSYVHFGWADVLVPLASGWKPVAVAWGVVSMYFLIAIELTSLAKKRLPNKLWRGVHYTSVIVYAASTLHLLSAGTDQQNMPLRLAAALSTAAATFLLAYRLMAPKSAKPRPRRVPVA